jgi:hypothetical protein
MGQERPQCTIVAKGGCGKDWIQNENLDNFSKKDGFRTSLSLFAPFLAYEEGS